MLIKDILGVGLVLLFVQFVGCQNYRYGDKEIILGYGNVNSYTANLLEQWKSVLVECFANDSEALSDLTRLASFAVGKTVIDYQQAFNTDGDTAFERILVWQECKPSKLSASEEETWQQLGIVIWPLNFAAMHNYAFMLEYSGHFELSKHLYTDCYIITHSVGCLWLGLATSPFVLQSNAQAEFVYLFKLAEYHQALLGSLETPTTMSITEVNAAFREVPVNWHYQGFYPGVLLELFSRMLVLHAPSLEDAYIPLPPPSAKVASKVVDELGHQLPRKTPIIRVGVVAEHLGNTSPGLCLEDILVNLPKAFPAIELIFFSQADLITTFAGFVRKAAKETIILDHNDLEASIEQIRAASLDILIYMALGTEKFTYLLAHARLAPVQILTGIGHPISPGLRSIDYVILPQAMLHQPYFNQDFRSIPSFTPQQCAHEAYHCAKRILAGSDPEHGYDWALEHDELSLLRLLPWCNISSICYEKPKSLPYHREQVVRFESLSYYLKAAEIFPYSAQELSEIRAIAYYRHDRNFSITCEFINTRLREMGLSSSNSSRSALYAEELGCLRGDGEVVKGHVHLYNNLQYMKKMHPSMDRVFVLILERDVQARIVVMEGFRRWVVPRLRRLVQGAPGTFPRLSHWVDEDWEYAIVEVRRVSHPMYLILQGLAHVFLTPFPYGAGITSSEALSICSPVLLLPRESAMINFALAQVRMMGIHRIVSASTIEEFAEVAILTAKNDLSSLCERLRPPPDSLNEPLDRDYPSISYQECISAGHIKDLICGRRYQLFGLPRLVDAVVEWGRFLLRVVE